VEIEQEGGGNRRGLGELDGHARADSKGELSASLFVSEFETIGPLSLILRAVYCGKAFEMFVLYIFQLFTALLTSKCLRIGKRVSFRSGGN
jgi:hypothetical protein